MRSRDRWTPGPAANSTQTRRFTGGQLYIAYATYNCPGHSERGVRGNLLISASNVEVIWRKARLAQRYSGNLRPAR